MLITDANRADILRDVNGNEADCGLVCLIIQTVQEPRRTLSFDVKYVGDAVTNADAYLRVRLAGGFSMFTNQQAKRLYALSQRIRAVHIRFSQQQLHVHVSPMHKVRWQPACQRPRVTAIDYAASNVTDVDDIGLMDAIVSDVYNAATRMPDTEFWFEPIVGDGDGSWVPATVAGRHIPLTSELSTAADDASESSVGAAAGKAPESARVGYSLCFRNLPDIEADFFRHLHDTHGHRVASAFAWFDQDPPLLVVNVRRTTASPAVIVQNVTTHLPRPLERPASKKRSSSSSGRVAADDNDDAAASTSMTMRNGGKRARKTPRQ